MAYTGWQQALVLQSGNRSAETRSGAAMSKLILFVLSLVFAITSYNLLVYTKHHDSNYCAAEIDFVKHGIGELLDYHGLNHLD